MNPINRLRRERALGVATGRRQYDLPLDSGAGTGFLLLLIGMMAVLAVLALAASFALSALKTHWSSGLESKVTVEIPAESTDGQIMGTKQLATLGERIESLLHNHPRVAEARRLNDQEIKALVAPWLGQDLEGEDLPLPGLIAVTLTATDDSIVGDIEERIRKIAPGARVETHKEWLTDILKLARTIQFAALILLFVTGVTMVVAIAGAVRARLAIHAEQIELLHLMGATDDYITRQFQKHARNLALRGGLIGVAVAGLFLALLHWMAGRMEINLLPDFSLGSVHIAVIACVPLFCALIATLTARATVLRTLEAMP